MKRTVVICSQVYPPDPTSVGQHIADVADAAARSATVRVITSRRGFANSTDVFPAREDSGSLSIRRIPFSSLGKTSMLNRIVGGGLFCLQCMARLSFGRAPDVLLLTTSPPMGAVIGVWVKIVRPRVRVVYWVMDLNPDQWIRVSGVSPRHPLVKMLDALNRTIFRRADSIIVLDRFMFERCARKTEKHNLDKFVTSPPWPHDSVLHPVARDNNPFIAKHGLSGKRIIMFSGNLGPGSGIGVVLKALREKPREDVVLVVIGGGDGRKEVEEAVKDGLENVLMLPYQPLDQIRFSLSAGDLHLVSVGEKVVGINHPCKIYGVLAVARPVVVLSPPESHLTEIVEKADCGWVIGHHDVDAANRSLDNILAKTDAELDAVGLRGKGYLDQHLSQTHLTQVVLDTL